MLLRTVYYRTIRCVLQDRVLLVETLRLVFALALFIFLYDSLAGSKRAIVAKIFTNRFRDLVKYLNPLFDNFKLEIV